MESGWHEIAARRAGWGAPVVPRFSVYLEREALERPRETLELASPEKVCGCNGDGDVYEPSARVRAERERVETTRRVETVQRVRVQMTSPAGRFLDLLI